MRWRSRPHWCRGATLETAEQSVQFELGLADYHAMLKHVCAVGSPGLERLVGFVVVFAVSFVVALLGYDSRGFVAGVLVGILLMVLKVLRAQRRLTPQPGRALLCRYDVRIAPAGVHLQTPNWTSDTSWRAILAVEETPAYCFFRVDTASVYTVPKRAFPNDQAMRNFIDFARDCVSRAGAGT